MLNHKAIILLATILTLGCAGQSAGEHDDVAEETAPEVEPTVVDFAVEVVRRDQVVSSPRIAAQAGFPMELSIDGEGGIVQMTLDWTLRGDAVEMTGTVINGEAKQTPVELALLLGETGRIQVSDTLHVSVTPSLYDDTSSQ